MTQISTGGYVRHRDRMAQESVFQDLQDTLIACRWMSGTTSHKVISPYDPGAGWQIVTTTANQVLPAVGKKDDNSNDKAEILLIDYWPEAGGNNDEEGESRKTEPNTFAVDTGVPQESEFMEMGSNMVEQPYAFTFAFYASSDGVALAVMNDLRDRYAGRIVSDDHLDLYNFNDSNYDGDTPPVVRMEIISFKYQQDAETVQPWDVHLYFGELILSDFVDSAGT